MPPESSCGHLFEGYLSGGAEQLAQPGFLFQFQAHQHVLAHRQMWEHRVALEYDTPVPVRLAGEGLALQ